MKIKSKNSKVKIISPSLRLCGSILLFVSGASAQWIKQSVDTTASLRGLSVVNKKVVWASGTGGSVIRTIDGGKTWKVMTVAGAEKLDFRDVEAFDQHTAYVLSIGNGESSRIYKTTDGGATWKEQFRNKNEKAFFDAMACWDRDNCIAMSDPVDHKFVLISTTDGQNWNELPHKVKVGGDKGIPVSSDSIGLFYLNTSAWATADEAEAAFAASGTCLITWGKHGALLVSGGSNARVFKTDRWGSALLPVQTSMAHGTAGSGIFSIAMFDMKHGVIVGGNYEKPNEAKDNLAFTTDGGETWKLSSGLNGYRSGVTYVDKKTIIAVGTNGSDITRDRGKTWKILGKEDLNAVQSKGRKATWAVGPKGLVGKLR